MWGASSPRDKFACDLPEAIETTQIVGFRSDRVIAGKLPSRDFGLLQQYRHIAAFAAMQKEPVPIDQTGDIRPPPALLSLPHGGGKWRLVNISPDMSG
jgi:hypothetical protein